MDVPNRKTQELMARAIQLPLDAVSAAVQQAVYELSHGLKFVDFNPRTLVTLYATFLLTRLKLFVYLVSKGVSESTATEIVRWASHKAMAANPKDPKDLILHFRGEVSVLLGLSEGDHIN